MLVHFHHWRLRYQILYIPASLSAKKGLPLIPSKPWLTALRPSFGLLRGRRSQAAGAGPSPTRRLGAALAPGAGLRRLGTDEADGPPVATKEEG